MSKEKFEIKHRYSGEVLFTASVDASLSVELKLGAAVKLAFKVGARLVGASLDGARLDGARLVGARLDGASLVGASLDGASLVGASLDGASLVGASLDGATGALDCGTPHGWRIVVVRHEDGIRIAAGCRWLTMSAAVAHWKGRKDRALMPALLAYIESAAKTLGWPVS